MSTRRHSAVEHVGHLSLAAAFSTLLCLFSAAVLTAEGPSTRADRGEAVLEWTAPDGAKAYCLLLPGTVAGEIRALFRSVEYGRLQVQYQKSGEAGVLKLQGVDEKGFVDLRWYPLFREQHLPLPVLLRFARIRVPGYLDDSDPDRTRDFASRIEKEWENLSAPFRSSVSLYASAGLSLGALKPSSEILLRTLPKDGASEASSISYLQPLESKVTPEAFRKQFDK